MINDLQLQRLPDSLLWPVASFMSSSIYLLYRGTMTFDPGARPCRHMHIARGIVRVCVVLQLKACEGVVLLRVRPRSLHLEVS